ncbi:biotin/lipoate A/B protein ligase family protein [Halobacteriales archaeon Cl-PHB]
MPDLADREWRLIREEARPGPLQMALDEVAAETAASGGPRTVRVYRWEPSTLSLGYHQDPATVDFEFCEREGITVTRRPTGGGAIYHDDRGDVSYSIAAPAAELPGDLMDSYAQLCQPLLDALEGIGVDAGFAEAGQPAIHDPACYLRELHPAHDVLAGGKKISGNAQYRRKDSVVQHGSLSFDRLSDRHLGCFTADLEPDAFEGRVTSVVEQADVDRETTVAALETELRDWANAFEGSWSADELAQARDRADEKFAAEAWTRDRVDPTVD